MEDLNSAVGYRFHPTDEELVDYYLKNKMLGNESQVRQIAELNVCDHNPWDLPDKSVVKSDDPEWFFFCPSKPKYSTGRRARRNTTAGHWKVTGKERKVIKRSTKEVIGTKRTLVFYKGKGFGKSCKAGRTNWVMHEYCALNTPPCQTTYVLCRLKKKEDKTDISTTDEAEPKGYEVEPSGYEVEPSDYTASATDSFFEDTIPELLHHQLPDLESLFERPPDYNFLSASRSQDYGKQGSPLKDLPFANVSTNCENHVPQFQSSNTEQEEDVPKCLDTNIVDPYECFLMHAFQDPDGIVSSDCPEVFFVQECQIPETSGLSNEHGSSKESMPKPVVQAPHGTLPQSHDQQSRGKNVVSFESGTSDAAHFDSSGYGHINCIQLVRERSRDEMITLIERYLATLSDSIEKRGTNREMELQSGLTSRPVVLNKAREVEECKNVVTEKAKERCSDVKSEMDLKLSAELEAKLNLKSVEPK